MLERLTIRQKLVLILLTTCGVAVLLSAIAFMVVSEFTLRNFLEQQMMNLSRVTGYNAQAALEFEVEEDATRILNGLSTRDSIMFAGLYTPAKKPLAIYHRKDIDPHLQNPSFPSSESAKIDDSLHVSSPIIQDGRVIGYIYLRDDMSEIRHLRMLTFQMVLLFLILALAIAYFILLRLQSFISGPIIHLAETARRVSDEKNYNLRATMESHDEVGFLIESFNSMLEQIELRDADLVRSNKELEQFAYVASHDLQEPLRMVTSYLQLLSRRYSEKLDQDADEFISYAVDGAKRMQTLIQDLLAFSRVGTRKLHLQPVQLKKTMEDVIKTIQSSIKEAKAKITIGPLPVVHGEPSLLAQLFQNLLTNAIKYHGDTAPIIEISALEEGEGQVISVKDNGIGISKEFAEKVFVIFQRLHTKEEYPGTGIGLAICKKIVERHQGKIWFESKEGEFTIFHVWLPSREKMEPLIAWEAYQESRIN